MANYFLKTLLVTLKSHVAKRHLQKALTYEHRPEPMTRHFLMLRHSEKRFS